MYVAGAKDVVVALDAATGKDDVDARPSRLPNAVSPTGRTPIDPIGG